jgi:hypothetical protein
MSRVIRGWYEIISNFGSGGFSCGAYAAFGAGANG